MMTWYNWVFIVMAAVGIAGCLCIGMAKAAAARNTHGMVFAAVEIAFWSFILYLNIHP